MAGRPSGQTAWASRPPAVMCSAVGILRIRAGRVPAASGLGPAWSFVPVKTGVNPPGVSIFRRVSAEGCRGIFGMAGPSLPVVLGGLGACFPGLPEGLVFPAAGVSLPVLPRRLGASLLACFPGGPGGGFFALFAPRFPVRRGRRRPRAGRKITGPQKTDLCKKSARGYPATGCGVHALGSVQ